MKPTRSPSRRRLFSCTAVLTHCRVWDERFERDGVALHTFAGAFDGDWETQAAAIEDLLKLGVDGTFATDNFAAGELIGRGARARMDASGAEARIVTLDGAREPISVDVLRNQGLLAGFGIDLNDPAVRYDEEDPLIVASGHTGGTAQGGRSAME